MSEVMSIKKGGQYRRYSDNLRQHMRGTLAVMQYV